MMVRPSDVERFNSRYEVHESGCWLWTAGTRSGYGKFSVKGRAFGAHRWLYERLVGPIPEGLQLDHLCRVRACVNPKHLEPVTHRVNTLRGYGACAVHARKTHCKQGHEFSEANTIFLRKGGRKCKSCKRRWGRERSRRLALVGRR